MAMDKNFDAATAEADIYARWERDGAFRAGANKSRDESFVIMIPPPNVTGSLHAGHAFNNTLQDIMIRWHRMRGFDTLWQPGTDHAGIATQLVVEKQLAADGNAGRRELGREKFLEKVWAWKEQSGGQIINQLKRLGCSCDWDRTAFTMSGAPGDTRTGHEGSANFHDAVLKVFVDLYNKGLIYKGKRLVNWDPHFETAISDLEVEQVETDGHLWRLRYQLEDGATFEYVEKDEDGNVTLREQRDYLVVATTRPETMLGDTGVAVHPDDDRYAHLVGKTVRLPLVGRSIPIVADAYADPEKGTGAVKITPAHDFNDWDVGKRTGLRVINIMDARAGIFLEGNQEFAEGCSPSAEAMALHGAERYAARKAIIELAKTQGWLDGIDDERHMVPHGDRSKVAIEPFLTDQWYVDAAKLAIPAMDAVRNGDVKILPQRDEKVYFHWLENIEPWCISRQLWWGHQVPVWYDEDGNEYCAPTEAEAQAAAGGKPLTRDGDVLDTWFSSGLWPIGTLGWPEDTPEMQRYFPTSTLITGFDILFFWVARMMMMQLEVVKQIPFDTIYLHALVRDEKGVKMSKTLGNVIDPLDIIDEFGADALRFTMTSMAALGGTLKLSTDRIKGYRNFGTKIWNAARFAEMNGCYEAPGDGAIPAATQTVNKWIIGETMRAKATVDRALGEYRFNEAALGLYAHTWHVVCDWYVEFAKPLLNADDPAIVAETRATMAWAIDQCLILLHPIMPFITEKLWGDLVPRDTMLIHQNWPEYDADADTEADAEMAWVINLIEQIRSVRAEMNVPAGAKIPLIRLRLDATGQGRLQRNRNLIERLARVPAFDTADAAPKGSVTLPVEGGAFCLPLADVIDISAEKARLDKALGKLEKEMGGLKGKLGNEKFLANAPEAVVAEQRARLSTAEDEAAKLREARTRVEELG